MALTVLYVPSCLKSGLHCLLCAALSRERRVGVTERRVGLTERRVGVSGPRPAAERRWYNFKSPKIFYLNAKARVWPCRSSMCRATLTAWAWVNLSCFTKVGGFELLYKSVSDRVRVEAAAERRGYNLKGLNDSHLNARARIWP